MYYTHQFFFSQIIFSLINYVYVHAKSLQSWLFANLWIVVLQVPAGSSVCGILQARTLGWVAVSSSRGSSQGIILTSPALADIFFTTEPPTSHELVQTQPPSLLGGDPSWGVTVSSQICWPHAFIHQVSVEYLLCQKVPWAPGMSMNRGVRIPACGAGMPVRGDSGKCSD